MGKGTFVLIIGPPGVGKTTIVDALLEKVDGSALLTTATTRAPRRKESGEMEVDGEDYYFLTKDEFQKLIDSGDLLEYMNNYGNFYGSSRVMLEKQLAGSTFVFCVMDVKGALLVKQIRPETLAIFVRPRDVGDCERRLKERRGVDPEQLKKRLANVETELSYEDEFDFSVVNTEGDLEFALRETLAILKDVHNSQ